jgi:hypothetical protein
MAHFAKIENGLVVDLIVVDNENCGGGDFPESEPIGQSFISYLSENDPRLKGTWLQTSYNTLFGVHYDNFGEPDGEGFRNNFGQIGFSYDSEKDIFEPPAGFYPQPEELEENE